MALIKCPECGKEISDKSANCIHCGFPLKLPISKCLIDEKEYDLENVQQLLNANVKQIDTIKDAIIDAIGISNLIYFKASFIDEFASKIVTEHSIPKEYNSGTKKYNPSVISCPRCGSTSITTGARGVNWTLGLIGASKTVNRCAKCGHTWQPHL